MKQEEVLLGYSIQNKIKTVPERPKPISKTVYQLLGSMNFEFDKGDTIVPAYGVLGFNSEYQFRYHGGQVSPMEVIKATIPCFEHWITGGISKYNDFNYNDLAMLNLIKIAMTDDDAFKELSFWTKQFPTLFFARGYNDNRFEYTTATGGDMPSWDTLSPVGVKPIAHLVFNRDDVYVRAQEEVKVSVLLRNTDETIKWINTVKALEERGMH